MQYVRLCCLKVERRHVVEHQADFAAEQFSGVLYADLLCKLHLSIVEFIHVAVDVVEVNIFIII